MKAMLYVNKRNEEVMKCADWNNLNGKRTKTLPDKSPPVQKWQGGQKPSRENDKADKSPPVKMTGRTKALPWKWLGGQKPSREINKADKSPPVTKYICMLHTCLFLNALNILNLKHIYLLLFSIGIFMI
jgi:hypothetical protein